MNKIMKKCFIIIFLVLFGIILFSNASPSDVKAENVKTFLITKSNKTYNNSKNKVEINVSNKIETKKIGYWKTDNNMLIRGETEAKIVSTLVDNLITISKGETLSGEALYDTATSIITIICSRFGLGGLTDSLFEKIKSHISTSPEDSIDLLQQHIDTRLDEVMDEIYVIEEDLDELFDELVISTDKIVEELYKIFEYEDARNNLENFFTKRNSNFNYNTLKECIFGDSKQSNGYYGMLINFLNDNPNSTLEERKIYFDRLYNILMSPDYDYANIFKDYLYSDENKIFKSIQQYYYDFLLIDPKSPNYQNAEILATLFMLDLYTTVMAMDNLILACNIFQSAYLKSNINGTVSDIECYKYGSGDFDYITYEQINYNLTNIAKEQNNLREQFIKDLVYILNIDESYTIKDSKNNLYYVSDINSENFGNVLVGNTIYMNQFSNSILNMFDLDIDKVTYYWYNNEEVIETNDGKLVVTNNHENLKCVVYYEDIELYSTSFRINDKNTFCGGNGLIDNPYLIGLAEQLNIISSNDKYLEKNNHYRLINNLDCNNIYIEPIGDNEDDTEDKFEGTFDGNGYTILNLSISNQEKMGLFSIIGENGEVRNLSFKNANLVVDNSDYPNYHIGALAGISNGEIINCKVIDSNIKVDIDTVNHKNKAMNVHIGGLIGESSGSVSYSETLGTKINVNVKRNFSNGSISKNSNNAFVGGLIGNVLDYASVSYCYADANTLVSTKITSHFENNTDGSAHIFSLAGGIIGSIDEHIEISNLYSNATEIEATCSNENKNWFGESNNNNCYSNKNSIIARRYVPSELAEKDIFLKKAKKELEDELIKHKRIKADLQNEYNQPGANKEDIQISIDFINITINALEKRIKNIINEWYNEIRTNLNKYIKAQMLLG